MEDDIAQFAYDQMVERALRGVVREALSVTETQGLPGFNHFYITFRTDHPGVLISSRLRSAHPHTMTIVLQNQFWDLTVYDETFGVTLSFSGRREHLTVPFEAITAFVDPHASFGLQFQVQLADGQVVDADDDEDEDEDGKDRALRDALRVLSGDVPTTDKDATAADAADRRADDAAPGPDDAPGGNVVTLDRFRKKP